MHSRPVSARHRAAAENNVDQLNTISTPLNILALNQPEQVQNHPNICYFALSPEDEARDAARHIWAQGKRTPLLLIRATRWAIASRRPLPPNGSRWAAAAYCGKPSDPAPSYAAPSIAVQGSV